MSKFILTVGVCLTLLGSYCGASQGVEPTQPNFHSDPTIASDPVMHEYDSTLMIYGPYASREAADAAAKAAGRGSWQGGYLTSSPPGVMGVRVVGYRGKGYYWW